MQNYKPVTAILALDKEFFFPKCISLFNYVGQKVKSQTEVTITRAYVAALYLPLLRSLFPRSTLHYHPAPLQPPDSLRQFSRAASAQPCLEVSLCPSLLKASFARYGALG